MRLHDLVVKARKVGLLASRLVGVSIGVQGAADGDDNADLPACVSGEITVSLPALRRWPAGSRLLGLRFVVQVNGDAE